MSGKFLSQGTAFGRFKSQSYDMISYDLCLCWFHLFTFIFNFNLVAHADTLFAWMCLNQDKLSDKENVQESVCHSVMTTHGSGVMVN